jgi:hypothetical protein
MRITVRMKDIRWEARDRYAAGVVREYNDYTGEIAPKPRWCKDNQFALTTGDKDAPFRILETDNIICGWFLPVSEQSMDRRYVSIPGKSGRRHNVYLSDDGLQFSCDCTGFGYRRTCSHVTEVIQAA